MFGLLASLPSAGITGMYHSSRLVFVVPGIGLSALYIHAEPTVYTERYPWPSFCCFRLPSL